MTKKTEAVISVAVMAVLSAANIAFAESNLWRVGAGKEVDVSGMDTDSYQVTGLNVQKDGSYVVHAFAAGFQSDIHVDATFDSTGTVLQEVKIASQAETNGIGSQVTEEGFTGQFGGVEAPITLVGKELDLVSPATGIAYGAAAENAETGADTAETGMMDRSEAGVLDPAQWNPEDQSPEAQAMRNLYAAGLTGSAEKQQGLVTPLADKSAEEQAMVKMARANLVTGNQAKADVDRSAEAQAAAKLEDTGLAVGNGALADKSAEEQAAVKLERADLVTGGQTKTGAEAADGTGSSERAAASAAVSVSEVDAVSGATISSTAVANSINHAYFFLQEQVLPAGEAQ
ncbi:MAG: FMN-binding protein [Lachnospiraceae bacterium]|nr:FMN-binding protein [Lachnospiraceae bacterium]